MNLSIRLLAAGLGVLATVTLLWPLVGAESDDFPAIKNSERSTLQPLPPAKAAAAIKLPPGFRATVFAAEPDVQNPIGVAWDNRGRMWVAENFTFAESSQRFDRS